ncbi:MAG: bifunctional hydroxymethylpyrimidine kinase/phosphomethylpyrimidine kinase [Micrococcus sp.]|nr:bifunctional hydroxymethylpyrimidine kinase/phosphomethylpyrimidine kinase [Micrococcus sp.]
MTTTTHSRARVLSIAGSDCSGGAGIQADHKTFAAWGAYGMSVITAVTAQNTQGVHGVHVLDAQVVTDQLAAIADDVTVDAVKVGMLGSPEVMRAVTAWLRERPGIPIVVDPVMVATSGHRLSGEDSPQMARAWDELCAVATVLTPNLPELAALTGAAATDWSDAIRAGSQLAAQHDVTVVLKGGHLAGNEAAGVQPDTVPDAVLTPDGAVQEVVGPWVDTRATHGTGCTLSSALAVRLAAGDGTAAALRRVRPWLTAALQAGDALHVGDASASGWHGPVDHGVPADVAGEDVSAPA